VWSLDEWGRTRPGGPLAGAAISIGTNPTFQVRERRVEAYLLDFEADLYGQAIGIEFVERLRGMETFAGVDPLVARMHEDVARTRALLA
jgi:riboflavin kinase/FMN adenylyltransferase